MIEWFKHDHNARNNPKLIMLRIEYGHAAVGMYWDTIEILHEQEGSIPMDMLRRILIYEAGGHADANAVQGIINAMIKHDLLQCTDENTIESDRVVRNLGERKKVSSERSRSAKSRWSKDVTADANAMQVHSNSNANAMLEEKKKRREEKRRVVKSAHDFKPPLRDHVRTMFKVRGSTDEEADRFFDHYDAQGWVRGNGQVIRNWQAMVQRWIERQKEHKHEHKQRTTRGERVGYDRDTTTEYLAEIAGALGGAQGQAARQLDGTAGRQALPGSGDTHPQ